MVYLTMLSAAESIQSSMFESLVNSELEQHRQCTCNATIRYLCIVELHVIVKDIKILTVAQQ